MPPARLLIAVAAVWVLPAAGRTVLFEAESFDDHGGWVLDPQFLDTMGSPYLMAHGIGRPVANAATTASVPEAGRYRVWVRTKDWVPDHHAGRFEVLVGGTRLGKVFGASGKGWTWEDGGVVELAGGEVELALHDLTGFNGRCDALLLTTDMDYGPPDRTGKEVAAWRRPLLGLPAEPPHAGEFDLVVVGGGVAGCSAALTAARLGLKVALVQNRPVLGGSASSEIGIRPVGLGGPVIDEVSATDSRERALRAERSLELHLGWHVYDVQMQSERIAAALARNTRTGRELAFSAPLFVDCTGDGWVGFHAGADHRMGREGASEFGESLAPASADKMTHGVTLYWALRNADAPRPLADVPWATEIAGDHMDVTSDHTWEYGHWRDMIGEAEEIRDHLLGAIIGNFANIKRRFGKATANVELARIGFIAARGESRRLMGDHILTQVDIQSQRDFPDDVATGGVVFCLHCPREDYDFRNNIQFVPVEPYEIPLRCLYSRNVPNLMMAGRDISATHVAYCSIKLQKTGGQMGRAVGAAAYLCRKYGADPRDVGKKHIGELKDILAGRGQYVDALPPD